MIITRAIALKTVDGFQLISNVETGEVMYIYHMVGKPKLYLIGHENMDLIPMLSDIALNMVGPLSEP